MRHKKRQVGSQSVLPQQGEGQQGRGNHCGGTSGFPMDLHPGPHGPRVMPAVTTSDNQTRKPKHTRRFKGKDTNHKKYKGWGWGAALAVMSPCYSCKGTELDSQHLHNGLQPSINSVPVAPMLSSDLHECQAHTWNIDAHAGKTLMPMN